MLLGRTTVDEAKESIGEICFPIAPPSTCKNAEKRNTLDSRNNVEVLFGHRKIKSEKLSDTGLGKVRWQTEPYLKGN